jgi:HAD superfamily hydrolase (TIGR01509 family)
MNAIDSDEYARQSAALFNFSPIVAVVSDIDGTLVDSVDAHAVSWRTAFARVGVRVDYDAIRAQVGKGADQLLPEFLSEDQLCELGPTLTASHDEIFERDHKRHIRPFPQVRELFVELRRRGKRAILATSGGKDDAKYFMGLTRITDLVDYLVTSDDVENSKPRPDLFEVALERAEASEPAHVVMIGDSPWDAKGARSVRMQAIGLLCGGFPHDDLQRAGCNEIVADISAVLAMLSGEN